MLKDYIQNNFKDEVDLIIAQDRFNKKLEKHTVVSPASFSESFYQEQFDYETLQLLNETTALNVDNVSPDGQRANCNGVMNIQLLNQLERIYDDLYEEYRLKPDNEEEINDLSMLITNISNAADRFYTMEHKKTGTEFLVSPSVVVRLKEDQSAILYDALTFIKSHDNWDQDIEEHYNLTHFKQLNAERVEFANSKVFPCLNDNSDVELKSIAQLEKDNAYYSMLTTNSLHFENDRTMADEFISKSIDVIERGQKGCFKPLAAIVKMLNTDNKTPIFKELKNVRLAEDNYEPGAKHYTYKSGDNYKVIDENLRSLKGGDGKAFKLSREEVSEVLVNSSDLDDIDEPKQTVSCKKARKRFR